MFAAIGRGPFVAAIPILVDGFQFLRPSGTGIASYVRSLTAMLKSSGCSVSVLYGQTFQPSAKTSPGAAAATVFSREIVKHGRVVGKAHNASLAIGLITGQAYRAKAVVIDTSQIDMRAIEPALPAADRLLNANRLYARANTAFNLTGKFTEVSADVDDCVFAASHWTGPIPVRMRGVPNIYTLHDLIPLQFPYFVTGYGGRMYQMHETIAREADHIITVSECSKRHIVEMLNVPDERVTVTYQPVPPLPDLDMADAERLVETIYGAMPGQYALFLGAIEPKKNIKRLVEAFLLADLGIPLLIAGPLGWLYDDDIALIQTVNQANQTEQKVRQLGFLPRRHVVALLKCAKFFVFPSIYEGFGLPVIEAMQLGIPVLTSNNSSLPEVVGDAAVQIDPFSISKMTSGLRRINGDVDLRNDLRTKGPLQAARFSPTYCQGLLAQAYKKVGVTLDQPVAKVL